MPPDALNRERLEKVLAGLEAEALGEQLTKQSLECLEIKSKSASTTSAETSPTASPRSEEVIPWRGYSYVDQGAYDLVWSRIAFFGTLQLLHLWAIFSVLFFGSWTNLKTSLFGWLLFVWSALGVTAGSHRLWSHKSYSARFPLRVFLMIGHCLAGQNTLLNWCRDHRVHHKFSETDSDPHNSKRGFFYAHVGWLLMRSHPDFIQQSKVIYCADLLNDPIVWWQRQRYVELTMVFSLILPIFIPAFLWGETLWYSFLIAVVVRYITCLHSTWFVNSAAHMFGDRPYNPRIEPRQNPAVSFGALGEGYHNYHHTYPWDYSTSESGVGSLNATTWFLNLMARFGLVYDRKAVQLRGLNIGRN